ncbi:hypothetical protein C8R45DRAFT_1157953 [Mycena sanguinolenta]|nr:hypothetical protein C8R45DRAFT_1157953 [Mycena sanguinolenta]
MNTCTTLIHRDQRSYEQQRQLIKGSFSDPAPGRTLNQVYSTLGNLLERQANRAAHSCGHGPSAIADRIAAYFGTGEQRAAKLDELDAAACSCREVQAECSKLAKYTLPCESARTQIQAFQYIVTTITRYHGMRALFLKSKHLRRVGNTEAAIAAVWARADDEQPWDWDHHCKLAAASLFETDISAILGNISPGSLGCVDTESNCLSVIERLLIASKCSSMDSTSDVIAQRYMTGILELPAFWQGNRLSSVLNDLGLDSGDQDEFTDLLFDNEGIDALASAVLAGVSGWRLANPESQYRYHNLVEIVRLLHLPETQRLLPKSSALAIGADFRCIVPDSVPETVIRLTLVNGASEILPMHADRISLRSLGDALDGDTLDDSLAQVCDFGPRRIVYTELSASFGWTTLRSEFSRFLSWSRRSRARHAAASSPPRDASLGEQQSTASLGFAGVALLVLETCQTASRNKDEATALAQDVGQLAMAVAGQVEELKDVIAEETELLEQISTLCLRLEAVHRALKNLFKRGSFTWLLKQSQDEVELQRLQRDIKVARHRLILDPIDDPTMAKDHSLGNLPQRLIMFLKTQEPPLLSKMCVDDDQD